MTKRELHEIAVTVRAIMEDECNEIRDAYEKLFGSLKGLKRHVRQECIEFWTNGAPYLDEEYLDYEWIKVGSKIINLDDCWCFIRDGLKELFEHGTSLN